MLLLRRRARTAVGLGALRGGLAGPPENGGGGRHAEPGDAEDEEAPREARVDGWRGHGDARLRRNCTHSPAARRARQAKENPLACAFTFCSYMPMSTIAS